MPLRSAALLALLVLAPAAQAQHSHGPAAPAPAASLGPVRAGALVVEQPWSRATPGGAKVAGGYIRITNTGREPDRLVGGSLAVAGGFEMHESSEADGVARMRPLERGLEIAPGQTVELRPGGMHVMFVDLKEPLREGQAVRGTLRFERAGTVEVTFQVRGIGARDAGHAHH
ncbi:copper chaperone PCu(A)C [Salinarimonas soli]|uniref:Copper chaperone PCu(A)C n=1 Tax=Salinarimonas soli TaxID=1638099 RepID=A0A5B2VBV2_9HYPH|nr:copper chaperone PCu(A)C [Salinarimonas soli]KAA2235779.1 copper chaperone PCu(A)C [Salinarimonas soli]